MIFKKSPKSNHQKKKFLLLCVAFSLLFAGCGLKQKKEVIGELPTLSEPLYASDFCLNTIVSVTLYDRGNEDVLKGCFAVCEKYEQLLSRTIDSSEISRLNVSDSFPVTVSEDTAALLNKALFYSELSGGAFDFTIAPLTSLWDFSSLKPKKPSQEAIDKAVEQVDYHKVQLDGCKVTFSDAKTAIDLGAIAKGYIADRIKDYLLSQGVESAIINLGGNILCVGSKPDGSGFKIGIQKPFEDHDETIAAIQLSDFSVVSSGIYERCFREDGQFYHHILDPNTGYPCDNGLISVTIISQYSVDGDGLSTACFALGLEDGMALIDSLSDVYAVFITDDYELHYSEGFQENIKILEE